MSGDKVICLAVTEPYAGSDVANIRTEAKKTDDGKHYIVNGEKKWITNAIFADFYLVVVRTGGMFCEFKVRTWHVWNKFAFT